MKREAPNTGWLLSGSVAVLLTTSVVCIAFGMSYSPIPRQDVSSVRSRSVEQDTEEDELAIVLMRLINAAPTGFRDLRAGTGKNLEGTVTYPCSVPVPHALSTVIQISEDMQPTVDAKFYSGKDKTKAEKAYDKLVAKVKRILPNWHGDETEWSSTGSRTRNYRSRLDESSASVSIRFTAFKETGNSSVYLTIWSPESLTPTSPPKNEPTTEWQGGPLEKLTKEVLRLLVAHDYDGIRVHFDSQMKERLSSQMLEQGWSTLTQQFGSFVSQEQPQTRKARGYQIVTILCRMEKGAIELEVDFDTTSEIGGLWLRPANPNQ